LQAKKEKKEEKKEKEKAKEGDVEMVETLAPTAAVTLGPPATGESFTLSYRGSKSTSIVLATIYSLNREQ
jgi:hypothetical protein